MEDLDKILSESVSGGSKVSQVSGTPTPWPVGSPPSPAVGLAKPVIAKIGYSHDAMIDLLIANPAISQNDLAAHFGYTASWVSQIMSSDAFQMRMAERREQIIDPVLRLTIKENFDALVLRSLDILRQKLNAPAAEVPDNLVLRTLDIGGRLAGYGVKDTPPPQVNQTDIHVHLEQLGGGLVSLLQRKKIEASTPALRSADALEGVFTDASEETLENLPVAGAAAQSA